MKFSFVLFWLIIVTASSCSKENTTSPNNDGTTLIKFFDLDTTKITGQDTMLVQEYEYDNFKRLVHTIARVYNPNGTLAHQANTIHYYNSNDILPFKEVETWSSGGSVGFVLTRYCSYSNNKLIYDSASSDNQHYFIRNYLYQNDKLIVSSKDNSTTPPTVDMQTIYFTRINGNTVLQRDTTSSGIINNFSFSYDDKKNPFAGKPQSPFLGISEPFYPQETYTEYMVYENNNAIDINQTSSYNFHFKYFYEYNINGYPTVARAYSQNSASYFFKRIFIYN